MFIVGPVQMDICASHTHREVSEYIEYRCGLLEKIREKKSEPAWK